MRPAASLALAARARRAAPGHVPVRPDINLDAERHKSVIRTTLLRYTRKLHLVNVLVCGKSSKTVE